MIRLTILTLIGLFAILVLMGDRDSDQSSDPATQDASVQHEAPRPKPAVAVNAHSVGADEVNQTPQHVQQFPGPELRPSPEHAGEMAQADAEVLAASGAEVMYVSGDRVNFRAGPSTNDRVIGALTRGNAVEVLGRVGDWVQLRDGDGREGYMSQQFLTAERPN